ncbi:MAG: glycosyltransferase [Candidatus Dadabacteria bacterium]|nr:glycosyltransferase [Candidatus Dadabacteria bacterium]NIQ16548.1 glycosyltransferase [Candidatus Dadabacteria bacterium]
MLVNDSKQIVKRNSIDIVYCNGTLAKIFGTFIGRKNSVPVIWHVRNIQQTRLLKFLFDYLSKFDCVKKIICVSNATARPYVEVKEKVHVVYNGIDAKDFDNKDTPVGMLRNEYSISKSTVIIGSTGRIVKRKGYKDFIDVADSIIRENGNTKNIKFVIVGDTPYFFPANHLNELKEYVKELGIEEYFVFTGYKRDIRPYLKDFDIFVIPSNYPDPFPRSVIEAMSFSLPVIGFEIGGIAEAIKHETTGFLCKPDNFDDMKNYLIQTIEDKKLRKEMGVQSRKRVLELCSAPDRTKDIENIILDT